jgi:hypothetical protein
LAGPPLIESRAVPTARTLRRHLTWLAFIVPLVVVFPQVAFAQEVNITPNFSQPPVHDTAGWTYKMAVGSIIVGLLVAVLFVVSYLRFAPGFSGQDDAPPTPARRPSPPPGAGAAVTAAPAPTVSTSAQASTAPSAAGAAVATATATATAVADPPTAAAATPPTPAPAAKREEVELDQETFDRVLKEELDKGTDRRVAEGRARASALRAARKKAQG